MTLALAALVVTGTGIAWASNITLTSKKLGASTVTTPVMFPVSVTLTDKSPGGTVGRPGNGDTIKIVWSRQVDLPTLCSGWSNGSTPSPLTFTWIITGNSSGNDILTTSGATTCTTGLHVGSIDLGAPGYNTSTTQAISFTNSTNTLTVGATTTTLDVVLAGLTGGSPATVAAGNQATWSCDSTITDRAGHTCGANIAKSVTTVQL